MLTIPEIILLFVTFPGFFVDLNLFKVNEGRSVEFPKKASSGSELNGESAKDDLADEDANLMIKLKFLTYKVWDLCICQNHSDNFRLFD